MAEETVETGQETPPPPPAAEEAAEGKLSGRSALRRQLEKNFEQDRKADTRDRGDGRTAEGKFIRGGRAAREATEEAESEQQEAAPERPAREQAAPETAEAAPATEAPAEPAVAAPEAWSREAKAEWAKLPKAVQAAVAKRETDTVKGVKELKGKYAQIDQALEPHMEAIRRHGRSPGEAVAHLFAWFAALSVNPQQAFPALAQSFGYDLRNFVEGAAAPEGQQQAQPEAAAPKVPKEAQPYVDGLNRQIESLKNELNQKLGQLENTFQQSSVQKAKETLAVWSKDKPYFEQVKNLMAELIGRGMVPVKEDGNVDLDAAYDRAMYFDPSTRQLVEAEKQQKADAERKRKDDAERKAQQERTEKARRAAISLGPSAPGAQPGTGKGGKGKSVRESLQEALAEHRGS